MDDRLCNYENIPLVLTVSDIMKILNIGKATAYSLVNSGKLESIRIGNKIRINKEALIDFLQNGGA